MALRVHPKGHPHKAYRRRTEGFSDGSQVCMPVLYKKGVKDAPPRDTQTIPDVSECLCVIALQI